MILSFLTYSGSCEPHLSLLNSVFSSGKWWSSWKVDKVRQNDGRWCGASVSGREIENALQREVVRFPYAPFLKMSIFEIKRRISKFSMSLVRLKVCALYEVLGVYFRHRRKPEYLAQSSWIRLSWTKSHSPCRIAEIGSQIALMTTSPTRDEWLVTVSRQRLSFIASLRRVFELANYFVVIAGAFSFLFWPA